MHLQEQSVGGIFDSLTKLVGRAGKAAGSLATSVVQGKQAYDATRAAWKGAPYAFPPAPTPAPGTWGGFPYSVPGATGERLPAPVQERPLTRAEISEIQAALNSFGFNTGAVDGIYGPNTAAGVRAYQQSAGLPVNGQLSVALLQRVRGSGSQMATQIPPFVQSTPTPNYSPPFYVSTPSASPPVKSTEEKLWTWVIPGVAALGGLLLVMSQRKGR